MYNDPDIEETTRTLQLTAKKGENLQMDGVK